MSAPQASTDLDIPVIRRNWIKEFSILAALALVLAAPWLLRPETSSIPVSYDRRLVILTPHNERIRHEFAHAFADHWKQLTGETLYVDWRIGGTSELAMMLRSDYASAFQQYWTDELKQNWTHEVATSFASSKTKTEDVTPGAKARKAFLDSSIGIGMDLFFGGGAYDFEQQAAAGILVAGDAAKGVGLKALQQHHPDWFTDAVIPINVSGEPFYDKELRWAGTCLSSLGICFNYDVLKRLGIASEPAQWEDLANPKLFNQIALSDPNKSGTVTKSLEQIIQQQMQLRLAELLKEGTATYPEAGPSLLETALSQGWERGLRLIQKISANARYYTDSSAKIPLEVAQGDAAAGMCIDFYGRALEEMVRKDDGSTRIKFIAPVGGSSVGVDPIGLLRGAPNPEVATAFMEFVLGDQGQKLWNYKAGTQGGPVKAALRRLPVRKDFYTETNRSQMTDSEVNPFEMAKAFTYHPEWTGSLFGAVRFIIKVSCINVHEDQQAAWQAIIKAGFPPRAMSAFENITLVSLQAAKKLAADLGKKDKELEMRLNRELTAAFRNQYRVAKQLAEEGL